MDINQETKRVIIGISGATGAVYGIRALELLKKAGVETHLVISPAARLTLKQETDWTPSALESLADHHYTFSDIGARIASGSFQTTGMLIAPCSIKTLSGVANAYAENLMVRAADVCLKEGRPLVLAVRETPLHSGHLRLMQLAAQSGAVIFPPVPTWYGKPTSLDQVVTESVGRMLARLGFRDESWFKAWAGLKDSSAGDL